MTSATIETFPVAFKGPVLSVDDIQSKLARRFKEPGLSHMTVANVRPLGRGVARADVVTHSGNIVLVIEVDRRTGEIISYR